MSFQAKQKHHSQTSLHLQQQQQQLPCAEYSVWFNNVSQLFMSPCLRENVMWAQTSLDTRRCRQFLCRGFFFFTAQISRAPAAFPSADCAERGAAARVVITTDGRAARFPKLPTTGQCGIGVSVEQNFCFFFFHFNRDITHVPTREVSEVRTWFCH